MTYMIIFPAHSWITIIIFAQGGTGKIPMITMMTHNLSMDQLRPKAPAIPAVHSISRAMRRELLEVPKRGEEDRRKGAFEGARFSRVFFWVRFGFRDLNWSCCLFQCYVWGGHAKSDKDGCRWGPTELFHRELVMSIGEKNYSKIRCFGWFCFWGGEPPHKMGSNFFSNFFPWILTPKLSCT